jgi:hypothetical protein
VYGGDPPEIVGVIVEVVAVWLAMMVFELEVVVAVGELVVLVVVLAFAAVVVVVGAGDVRFFALAASESEIDGGDASGIETVCFAVLGVSPPWVAITQTATDCPGAVAAGTVTVSADPAAAAPEPLAPVAPLGPETPLVPDVGAEASAPGEAGTGVFEQLLPHTQL